MKQRGPMALYRGLPSLLVGTAPKASIRFMTFGQVSKLLQVLIVCPRRGWARIALPSPHLTVSPRRRTQTEKPRPLAIGLPALAQD